MIVCLFLSSVGYPDLRAFYEICELFNRVHGIPPLHNKNAITRIIVSIYEWFVERCKHVKYIFLLQRESLFLAYFSDLAGMGARAYGKARLLFLKRRQY